MLEAKGLSSFFTTPHSFFGCIGTGRILENNCMEAPIMQSVDFLLSLCCLTEHIVLIIHVMQFIKFFFYSDLYALFISCNVKNFLC